METLSLRWQNWMAKQTHSRPQPDDRPLRGELFSLEQLVRHAKTLAARHQVVIKEGPNRLLARLDDNEKILRDYNRTTLTVDRTRRVTPAAEWLVDNAYLIEEQIVMARRHLPRGYSRELPRLLNGPSRGLPRVYDLVLELISRVDAQIDPEPLRAFVSAYQTVAPLKLGELWAVPIMLRLGLIENLRRITIYLGAARRDRDLADLWADRLQKVVETNPSQLIVVVAEMAKTKLPLSSAFGTEFWQRLSRLNPTAHLARNWIEQRLAEQGLSIEQLVLQESQNQAADQVSIGHSITSLRFLGAMDWRDFVETMSLVNQTLRKDPAEAYPQMNFLTRDRYRHCVEEISRYGDLSEQGVAQKAIDLAENRAREKGHADRTAHVGYYLIDKGRPDLESAARVRWPWGTLLERSARKFPLMFYIGSVFLITILTTAALTWQAQTLGIHGGKLIYFAVILLLCSSQLAVALVNWWSTLLVKPRLLPRLDFSEGIPADCRTMVVVPTMLSSPRAIEQLIETLEIHYLANRDTHLHFGLLTDFLDARQQNMPGDEALIQQVRDGIDNLNGKYQSHRSNIFFLFHRPRRWNEAEGVWMGYERKRGKLAEFNALLRGRGRERFSEFAGDSSVLPSVKYVITLDTDTKLPRDAARRLVGTIAHPLNQPQFDSDKGIVCEGYGILQPRVGVSLLSAGRSWFVRLFAGEAGIDPYTRAVSDVYQDIFNEGSFIGKGIYDVDAFERSVRGRFPENTVLSHDLIESVHARSGLVSDVELYEEHPSRYNADINRRHRWIRGDWQIAQWLLPRVPGPDARRIANPLSGLSLWKIFDNLRRSLVPAALMLLLLGNWILLPELHGIGPLAVLAIITIPGLLSVLVEAMRKPAEWPLAMHLRGVAKSFGRQIGQIALTLVFLPYDACISLDAIGRTLVRLLFTRTRLLEWQTASEAERNARTDLAGFYATMWLEPLLASLTLFYLLFLQPEHLPMAAPILALWAGAPWIAWWISQPIEPAAPELERSQLDFLRTTARKTWRFFEAFVTAEDNWLPPDNFQEQPAPVAALRTSPTNMGLALLANLAACDFGYLSMKQLIERTENTVATMQRLERYRGHFYNWYDTRSLKPLLPHYISTVDSGNLAGHLLILGAGLMELADQKIIGPQTFLGLRDTARILSELAGENSLVKDLNRGLAHPPATLRDAFALLQRVTLQASQLLAALEDEAQQELKWWSHAFERNCRQHLEELLFLVPWLPLVWKGKPPIGEFFGVEKNGERKMTASSQNGRTAPRSSNSSPENQLSEEEAVRKYLEQFEQIPTLREIAQASQSLSPYVAELSSSVAQISSKNRFAELFQAAREASRRAGERVRTLESLARQTLEMAEMDFGFLFDPGRELFAIGYNATECRRDSSFYDLLASEARLGSYVAIAQGQVPQDHWFSLGRLLATSRAEPVLVSWSGSMFEYLMPLLVMPTYEDTLLDRTCKAAVRAQIEYGRIRGVPWGVSESGYNSTDVHLNYQYRAFGVPGLGFKRGLTEDLVIAPYASMMALMVAPKQACENLLRLAAEGRTGDYGFYEAVDYTPSRLPPGQTSVTVRSFMAHHQGMSLLALAYLLLDRPMQRRFLSYPVFKAAELLLQERVPKTIASLNAEELEMGEARELAGESESAMRIFTNPNSAWPEVHLLSNGRYHLVVTSAGGGYSRWQDLALTRWREDATRDCWGSFCYIRDVESGEFWSLAYQPTAKPAKRYEAIFTQGRAEFRQRQGELEFHTEISVSPEDDVELRRVTITNHSNIRRTIELTSYAEVVLAPPAADAAHPAFSNLFVQTEFVRQYPAILCTRRPRSAGEKPPWLLHLMAAQGEQGATSFETDRSKFIGRGRSLTSPAALFGSLPLSNSEGSVLDPIVSLRRTIEVGPEETARIDLVMGIAESRDGACALAEKYQNYRMADRLLDLAWTHSQVTLRHLDATEADAQLYARLAGALVYANPARRASPIVLLNNRRAQSGLWVYGMSGDLPVVLLHISDASKMDIVRRLVQAHAYWRMKGLPAELMILNEDASVYRQSLHDQIIGLISSGIEAQMLDKPGGIFVRRLDQISMEDRVLLQSVARVVLSDENGTLAEQIQRRGTVDPVRTTLIPTRPGSEEVAQPLPARDLVFSNGLGGFTRDGREYIITLRPEQVGAVEKKNSFISNFPYWRGERPNLSSTTRRPADKRPDGLSGHLSVSLDGLRGSSPKENGLPGYITPAPWVNVLANPSFGTVISEAGSAYTWLENSHEFRLTPWNNDPVTDAAGEAFYIRDEESGQFWSPTPLPARGVTPYVIRHGFGYSVFEHTEQGIASEMWVYVALDAAVKFTVLKLRNISGRPRRLSVTGYWEWVLGDLRHKTLLHLQTEIDLKSGALLARNPYSTEFAERVAFVDVNDPARTVTGDRKEFIGRNGTLASPAALRKMRLSGKTGAGLDPCGAIQVAFDLPVGQERETSFHLGAAGSLSEAQDLIRRFRRANAPRAALEEVWAYWTRTLGAVYVETPDPAVNIMANGWLLYQTLSCRLWGRTGFYQSGGAFGFRDQLQDAMALVHAEPTLLREHLLRSAAHQFREGDVQHWWHPPTGRGVRTHISDDYLWLPYATCRYLACLNDTGVLDEQIPFLEGRAVKPEEESYFDLPTRSGESGTLYEHCVRAIEHGLKFGEHGLPLIGCGDWNDGFNLVGAQGKGESVWLAFFLHAVLTQFSELARKRNDLAFAERCRTQADQLRQNIELHAWDGQWYRRAYFDNGEPLGSQINSECQIDSLPQSWSVITGAGDPQRSRQAMKAVEQRLIRREAGLIQLFDPPFDKSPLNPGYIKGYVPGVRENGGQYTHGAIWAIMAFAQLGEHERAWELFSMLNPINHGRTPQQIATYKVEPYVVAADIYATQCHLGRGGWTWYTGSAGWMYRLLIETLLGLRRDGEHLRFKPLLPKDWSGFRINYRYRRTNYRITASRSADGSQPAIQIVADGQTLEGDAVLLVDDQCDHNVEVKFGDASETSSRISQLAVHNETKSQ